MNTHPLQLRVQTLIVTMIVSVVVLQEDGNISTSRFSNTTFGHILIGLYTLLQRSLLNDFHCSSINSSQIRNRFDVHQEIDNEYVVHFHNELLLILSATCIDQCLVQPS